MKQLDWKSFAIGVLLTTTVVFGVAATNPTTGKQWDENQKWAIYTVSYGEWRRSIGKPILSLLDGMEPFASDGREIHFRAPVKDIAQWHQELEKKAQDVHQPPRVIDLNKLDN